VGAVSLLARHYHCSPEQLSDAQLQAYLLYLLREKHNSPGTLIVAVSALRFFYRQVLGRPTQAIEQALPRMKRPVLRPRVFSSEQIARLLAVEPLSVKHRTELMVAYATGLRASELCRLRPEHILSDRGQIRVEQGKGKKDRYTVLSPRLLEQLRQYWRVYRPTGGWLFPSGPRPGQPICVGSVQSVYWRAVRLAGLPRNGGVHALRHTFATHLLEAGVPLPVIQRLMGHRRFETTMRYLHVRRELFSGLHGLLEALDQNPLISRPD
jgi:integrase